MKTGILILIIVFIGMSILGYNAYKIATKIYEPIIHSLGEMKGK